MIGNRSCIKLLAGMLVLGIVFLIPGYAKAEERKTIYTSPYVSLGPDGKAFTICGGDRNYKWYAENDSTTVYTGIKSSLRSPEVGEHYYTAKRYGEVPVGTWRVVHRPGQCIHDEYPIGDWHGISFRRQKCMNRYYSGWKAFCADCGKEVEETSVYMSREAAESIQYWDLGSEEAPMHYYYLCPFCHNLEQAVDFEPHSCLKISWNQYMIIYDSNSGQDENTGMMPVSYHMYNNATEYEGETVTPVIHLNENNYVRIGYVFTGWNTEPDGSGTFYEDKAEIYNLSSVDWHDENTWTEEDNGKIILYAQWRQSASTLIVDAAEGTYNDRDEYTITKPYGERYRMENDRVRPPKGYRISFETNGGTKVESVTGTKHFVEWNTEQPFLGYFDEDIYNFKAPDGNVDRVTAVYKCDEITLPDTDREGWSFAGWYYDPEFNVPAGGAGDRIIPIGDTVLYAQWVELKLQSRDNYTANDGKGAVDLTWRQLEQKDKTYLVYQKRESGPWIRVNSASDINSIAAIEDNFTYSGRQIQYVVPYTGIYTITAMGAQGQSYASNHGGYGGSVTGTFWLKHGEILTCTVGGQNGYHGGGAASAYGNGGGMTSVVSDLHGELLIAGGGGGAYPKGDGGIGGSLAGVKDGHNGQSGMSGGGAGHQGGIAGTYTPEVKELRFRHFGDVGLANTWQYVTVHGSKHYGPGWTSSVGAYLCGIWGENARYYQVNGKWQENPEADSYVNVNGQKWWPLNGWNTGVTSTNGSSVRAYLTRKGLGQSWPGFDDPCCNGEAEFVQGYWTVVQQASNTPSYGGSNYINKACAQWYDDQKGVRSGNGYINIHARNIGYQENTELSEVTATDMEAPDRISDQVTLEALDRQKIRVIWEEPDDNGTAYYHKVESYLAGSTSKLCDSNITKNILISGVSGYYWVIDQDGHTKVTAGDKYTKNPRTEATVTDTVQYLHVAAVDKAGNIGETTHIRITAGDVLWKLYTRQLAIDETVENVYPASEKTWYVRADGVTPFTLRNESLLEGMARYDYQLNDTIYETALPDGTVGRNRIYTPSAEIVNGTIRTNAEGLIYATEGTSILQQYPYSYTVRSNRNSELIGVQKFTIDREVSGQRIQIIPVAGADYGTDKVYSEHTQDERNKIVLIADGEAPVIRGLEILEHRELIDRRDGDITIHVTAEDNISGVQGFYVKISNTDNAVSRTYSPGQDGTITIIITEDDPIFSGDFTVLGYASDHVGNENSCIYGTTEFALESSVERIMEPHDPVFKCGESGKLNFTTWGYADRVEVIFPECMTALDPSLNTIYDYTDNPGYKITEELIFMIPLYTPENQNLEITIRAYKGNKKLEDHPTISVIGVSGTVLDELRTRLR